jgi:hypothetical protein
MRELRRRAYNFYNPGASGAQPGAQTALPLSELRSSSIRFGVGAERHTLYPGLRFACTGVIEILRPTA